MTMENNGMYMPVAPAYGGSGGFGLADGAITALTGKLFRGVA